MGFVRKITGQDAAKRSAKAALESADIQRQAATDAAEQVELAGAKAGELFQPYANLGQQGIDQAGFLTDSQAQFDFLQNNPLFQGALDNANQQTLGLSAARGRLSSGDTLQQLSNNTLLTASPLIQQQKQSINDLLNIGQGAVANQGNLITGTASNQANLLTGAAAAQAGGLVGAANARNQGDANLGNIIGSLGGAALGSIGGPIGSAIGSGIGGSITSNFFPRS